MDRGGQGSYPGVSMPSRTKISYPLQGSISDIHEKAAVINSERFSIPGRGYALRLRAKVLLSEPQMVKDHNGTIEMRIVSRIKQQELVSYRD